MKEDYRSLILEYYESLLNCGMKKRNALFMKNNLTRFFEYLEEGGLRLEEVSVREAQGFQGWLIERGRLDGLKYAKGSIRNFIKAAVSFYNFLKINELVGANPFAEIKKIRVDLKLPRHILKEKEMAGLLEGLSFFDREGGLKKQKRRYRAHVVSELMYSTALRISEAASLKEEDIDFERGVIEVEEGKGGRKRTVFMNEYTAGVLYLYLTRMRPLVLEENSSKGLLFGAAGNRLDMVVNEELKKACGILGLKPMTSHGFRHAVGFHLLRAGCDIRHIQDILGHEKIRSTEIYTRVEKEDLRKVLDKYHPRQFRSIRDEEADKEQGA